MGMMKTATTTMKASELVDNLELKNVTTGCYCLFSVNNDQAKFPILTFQIHNKLADNLNKRQTADFVGKIVDIVRSIPP